MEYRLEVKQDHEVIYPIVFRKDFSDLVQELQHLAVDKRRVCIVTESHVGPLYLNEVMACIEPYCKAVTSFTFEAGEENKNLSVVQNLYEHLIIHQFDRKDLLIALGGGVVGDLTGFTAATYFRGIDFVQIPSSLLAQTDSSVGGKTGVDFRAYKNVVGAFHQPKLVYMNLSMLNTLSKREFNSGLGEIIKHGLIKDADYFMWLKENKEAIAEGDLDILMSMIMKSCDIKRQVVEHDPKEQGERALLNYGHTLGHAIEKLMDFQLLHGECVVLGIHLAGMIALNRGNISQDTFDEIYDLFRYFDFPKLPTTITKEDVVQVSKSDKKMQAGTIKFILIHAIGSGYIDTTVTDEEMLTAWDDLLNYQKLQ